MYFSHQKKKIMKQYGVTPEYVETLMTLTKQRLGIMSGVKDASIEARLLASIAAVAGTREIRIDTNNYEQLMLLVDIAAWEYGNAQNAGDMPRHLRYRLNCLFVNNKAGD